MCVCVWTYLGIGCRKGLVGVRRTSSLLLFCFLSYTDVRFTRLVTSDPEVLAYGLGELGTVSRGELLLTVF